MNKLITTLTTIKPKVDLTNNFQKGFAIILLLAFGLLYWYMLPSLVYLFKHTVELIVWAVITFFIVFHVTKNPQGVLGIFKSLSFKLTQWTISKDRPGYLWRYHEYLEERVKAVNSSALKVRAIFNKIASIIAAITNSLEEYMERYEYIEKQKPGENTAEAAELKLLQRKISIDTKRKEQKLPQAVDLENKLNLLKQVEIELDGQAKALKYEIEAILEDYELNKEFSAAGDAALDAMGKDSEQYRNYIESKRQIEIEVNRYIANIQNFETKVLPMLASASIDKGLSEEAGLKIIEEFKRNRMQFDKKDAV